MIQPEQLPDIPDTLRDRLFIKEARARFREKHGQPLKMGSLNKAQRLATLQSLIDRGYLDSRCRPTKKGIENSGPRFWKDGR